VDFVIKNSILQNILKESLNISSKMFLISEKFSDQELGAGVEAGVHVGLLLYQQINVLQMLFVCNQINIHDGVECFGGSFILFKIN
jgi:hypothetical protein